MIMQFKNSLPNDLGGDGGTLGLGPLLQQGLLIFDGGRNPEDFPSDIIYSLSVALFVATKNSYKKENENYNSLQKWIII